MVQKRNSKVFRFRIQSLFIFIFSLIGLTLSCAFCSGDNEIELTRSDFCDQNIVMDSVNHLKFCYPEDWKTLNYPGKIFYASELSTNAPLKIAINFEIEVVPNCVTLEHALEIQKYKLTNQESFKDITIVDSNSLFFHGSKTQYYEVTSEVLKTDVVWFQYLVEHHDLVYVLTTLGPMSERRKTRFVWQKILNSFEWI